MANTLIKPAALKEYLNAKELLEQLLAGIEKHKETMNEILKGLYETHGKGVAYDLGDDRGCGWVIAKRGEGTYFMIPCKEAGKGK